MNTLSKERRIYFTLHLNCITDIHDAMGNILRVTQMLQYLLWIKYANTNNTCFDYKHNTLVDYK
jgi:hypothetical protein